MSRADSRTRLREFQENLAERLSRARSTPVAASRLGFLVNEARWVVDLGEAGEIVSIGDITAVPHTYPWFRGLTNVRGALVSVVDLSVFLGGAPTRLERESRVLSFAPTLEFNAGVLVTRMLGLRDVGAWVPEVMNGAVEPWASTAWRDGAEVWREISLRQLAVDDRFLKISPL